MKTLYLDAFAGISGDMFLGLLIDLGLAPDRLREALAGLALEGWRLEVGRERRGSITGTRVVVHCALGQPPRHWPEIDALLGASALPEVVSGRAREVFRRLGEAEAGVHGIALDEVHFHEVGALDAIIDVAGTVLGLHLLGVERLYCAPLPLGRGFVDTEHGRLPLPAPATAALLAGHPLDEAGCDGELVTPTGAALASTLAEFGELPAMVLDRVGYGVGARVLADRPNLLRGFLGCQSEEGPEHDRVLVLESHLDDANPEWLGYLMERLLAAGALDVVYLPAQMKKHRPGVALTVIAPPALGETLARMVLHESSASGVRRSLRARVKLARRAAVVETRWGAVAVKLLIERGEVLRVTPEFEDCRRIARDHGIALPEVYRVVSGAGAGLLGTAPDEDGAPPAEAN